MLFQGYSVRLTTSGHQFSSGRVLLLSGILYPVYKLIDCTFVRLIIDRPYGVHHEARSQREGMIMGRGERWERKDVNIGGNWGCKPQELPPAGEGLFFEKNLQLCIK